MSEKGDREVVERYMQAVVDGDLDAQDALRHANYVSEYPQSGERIRGAKNARAILDNYPGGTPSAQKVVVRGSEDRWVATPIGTVLRITGTGDVYTVLATVAYPGELHPWHMVSIIELRDGKVAKETQVFGAPFDPPAWRAQWVERM